MKRTKYGSKTDLKTDPTEKRPDPQPLSGDNQPVNNWHQLFTDLHITSLNQIKGARIVHCKAGWT